METNCATTPGPWSVFSTYAQPEVRGEDGSLVAVLPVGDLKDARLIAAAPDLLAALEGLDEAYCRAGTPLTRNERTEDRKRLIAARAAIAKATGATE